MKVLGYNLLVSSHVCWLIFEADADLNLETCISFLFYAFPCASHKDSTSFPTIIWTIQKSGLHKIYTLFAFTQ